MISCNNGLQSAGRKVHLLAQSLQPGTVTYATASVDAGGPYFYKQSHALRTETDTCLTRRNGGSYFCVRVRSLLLIRRVSIAGFECNHHSVFWDSRTIVGLPAIEITPPQCILV